MDHLAGFRSLRATMERCSEIVCEAYSIKPEDLYQFEGELPPGHKTGHRRQRYWVTEVDGDMVVALPGTTHPLDWSTNMCVHYTPVDGSHADASTPPDQLEQVPCAHAGFYFRAETIPTLALLEQAAAKGMRLVLTGHSLGAAVANICALTALSAQKKAREAAANAACAKRAASADSPAVGTPQEQQPEATAGSSAKRQKQQKKNKLSPFQAAASAAAVASAEAHTNHSWCSANGDVVVSPQAALVDVVCVAFASPHWANQGLAHMIEDNDWGDAFVNVVVPEDYCLKLFNNVLTSANPAERHSLSRSNSAASLSGSGSNSRLNEEDCCCEGMEPIDAADGCGPDGPVGDLEKQQLYTTGSDGSTATAMSTDSSSSSSSLAPRYSYQPGGQQPLVSALAGTRRKLKKQQLSFALPDQEAAAPDQPAAPAATDAAAAAAAADTPVPVAVPAAAVDSKALLDVCRPPPVSVGPCGDRLTDMYAAQAGSWSELCAALPPSPSCASLSSLSSLNSTRSWTLLAYLPDVLIRSFSNGSSSSSGSSAMDGANSVNSSRNSSNSGFSVDPAHAVAAAFMGPEPCAPTAAAVDDGPSSRNGSGCSTGGWGMRHAKSSVDLTISSLSDADSPATAISSSMMMEEGSASITAPLGRTEWPATGTPSAAAALLTEKLQQPLQQQQQQQVSAAARARGLRRSMTSASLKALIQPPSKLLGPLKLSSSLAMVSTLLPSLRSVAHASRAVLNTASSIKEAAFNVPLTVFEAGLIKALKPPMYKPVGQQWILSATGLVPQQHPIYMYPKHVHDVFWHKELALVAFREHSIVFYKRRLLQQANRR